ncbi:MAG: hypothetical protein HGB28_05580, partial [Oscillochloris sp.]|nr:hypothetical protein [Oscillochloris sp.]
MIFHTGMLLGPNGTPLTLSLGLALVLANHFWRVSAEAERLNLELAERNRDLAESRDHLEDLVRERTTALRLVNTSLELAVDHAQSANRAKSAFLASMSHEIRTPLNAVIGMASLLQDTPLTSEQRVFTDTITTGGQALLGVISDILDFSRIESERLELEAAPFDLHACLASAIDLVAHAARQKGLAVHYTRAPDVPQAVVGDEGRLRQVLLNLLGNA